MPNMQLEKAYPHDVDDVVAFVSEILEETDCSIEAQMATEMAVEEMFLNIAKYAYAPNNGPATISVELQEEPPVARITFIDSGVAFNPLDRPDPDLSLPVDERPIGGLGIYMTKKTMDSMTYERNGDRNILCIEKGL